MKQFVKVSVKFSEKFKKTAEKNSGSFEENSRNVLENSYKYFVGNVNLGSLAEKKKKLCRKIEENWLIITEISEKFLNVLRKYCRNFEKNLDNFTKDLNLNINHCGLYLDDR